MAAAGAPAQEGAWTSDLTPDDWVLILLGSSNGAPIRGKTSLVKQLFVLGMELIPDVAIKFAFFPSRFGPYTGEIEPAIRHLTRQNLLVETRVPVSGQHGTDAQRSDFALTDAGRERAQQLLRRIPADIRARLDRYKRTMSGLGLWGLIHYVYSNYPDYTILSELEPP